MKRRDRKFISMITAVALSFSMVLNYSPLQAKGAQTTEDGLKELLKESINEYESNNSNYSKSNNYKSNAIDENGTRDKDPEEEIRVIVQLDDAPAINSGDGAEYTQDVKENEKDIKGSQSTVMAKAEEITGSNVRRSFGYLVNGFSISTQRKNIEKLEKIDGVKCVTEVRAYKPDMQYAKQITGVTNEWKDLGYKGQGMVVSIIDTGIDYNHKDLRIDSEDLDKIKIKNKDITDKAVKQLGYGNYFNDKVPFGHNYADDNDNVIDTGNMHGMHVAGIVAANAAEGKDGAVEGVKGVAPEAQLLAMKVFTNNPGTGSAYDDDIIAAIEDSVKLGADVINMSLGSTAGFTDPDDPENQAVKRATDAGVMCVISAGNESTSTQTDSWSQPINELGLKDTSTVGSPSTAASSLSVASMENTKVTYSTFKCIDKDNNEMNMQYGSPELRKVGKLDGKFEIVDCETGSAENFEGKDLSGKIALIKRGKNTFQDKYNNAINHNASGVIIYNHETGGDAPLSMEVKHVTKPVVSIGCSDGKKIKEDIDKGNKEFTLDMGAASSSNDNIDNGDMSQYTSWGATSDLEFKPEITAPGGDIYSLANNNSYQTMSGTSMAAPNTSGSQAIIMQAAKARHPELKDADLVKFVKNTAMNTAHPMLDKYDETKSIPYSPRRQGAGLIQVEDAVKNNVIIDYKDGKGAAALKEVGNSTSFELKLTNYGKNDVTYKLKDEKVYGEKVEDKTNKIHEIVLDGSSAKFDKSSVTVKAGETAVVNVTLNISNKEEADRFVEGYLNFESTNEDAPSLSVPFMGFYGDWSKESIVDTPNYEGSNSLLGVTGLVSKKHNLLGTYVKNKETFVDKDKVAFSPNEDGFKDEVIPALRLLRNAKELKVEVIDNDGKVIRDLYSTTNVRKNVLEDGFKAELFNAAAWDGTVYDTAKGKYVKAEDGKYTIRIKSKVELENAKEQVLDLPVKIDTEAPKEVKISGVEKYTDKDGNEKYKLSWTAEDNEGGSGIEPVSTVFVNGKDAKVKASDISKNGDKYSVDIPFNDREVNNISLEVADYAGNMAKTEAKEKAANLKALAISGLSDGMVIGKNDLKDGKFVVTGTASDDLRNFKINEKDVEVKENYFEQAVDVVEGENLIKVYAEGKDGKKVSDDLYKVILDTKTPEVTVKQGVTDKEPYFTVYDDELTLDIAVKDDTECSAVLVNDSKKDENDKAIKSDVSLNTAKEGTGKIKLVNGLNKIELKVTDKAGNESTKTYLVMKGDNASELSVTMDNLSVMQYFNKTDTKDGVYTVKGHVSKKTDKLVINDENVKVNDDLTFTYDVKLNEGRNMLKVYAKDNDETVTADYSYKIYYDETAPKLSFKDIVMRADKKAYVNNADFTLKGVLDENLFGYALYVNGDLLMHGDEDPSQRGKGIHKEFSKNIKLKNGENTIKLSAADTNGNEMNEDLDVVLDTEAPSKPEIKLSTDKLTNKPVTVTLSSDEKQLDRIEYSTDGVNFVKYTDKFTVGASSKVYARSVDYAGNTSEASETEVKVDTTKPVVTLNGVVDGGVYYEPVKLSVDVDDKNATTKILVNGKEYNDKYMDVEGTYNVEAVAIDEAGNVSDVVKKSFKLAQNSTTSADGDYAIIKHNNIKPAGDNYLYESLEESNVKANFADPDKGDEIVTPADKVTVGKDVVKDYGKEGLEFTQKVYEDKELLESLNSIGKVFEVALNNGKNLKDLGNDKITVNIKLDKDNLKDKDVSKLKAYVYDEGVKEWNEIEGTFDDVNSIFTFATNKLGKFTVGQSKRAEASKTYNNKTGNPEGNGQSTDSTNGNKVELNSSKNTMLTSAKTGDGIALAGAVAAVALVAGAIAVATRKKK